jgi:hypothetical protein
MMRRSARTRGSRRTPKSSLSRSSLRGASGDGSPTGPMALLLLVPLVLLLSPPVLEAQSPAPVSQGTRSLSFGIDGSGSGEAGIWYFISDRSNLGLLGTLDWVSEDRGGNRSDRSQFTLGLGPRIKWYVVGGPRIAPFWYGGLGFTHTRRSEEGESDRSSRGAGIDGGFGVDWFPVDQMSIGGWTGLRFSSDRAENDDSTSRLRTVTTGLRVHLYF